MTASPARAFKDAAYAHLAAVGKALSSPLRVELLELLAQAPRTVEALAAALDQPVANTSHHLQALKRAQLVRARRAGLHVTYSLAGPAVAALVGQLHAVGAAHLAALEALKRARFAEIDPEAPLDRAALLARLRAGDIVLLDVRPAPEHAAGHLPGALSVPLEHLDALIAALPRDRLIVATCRGPLCSFSAEAVRRLRALGFTARRADVGPHDLAAADLRPGDPAPAVGRA